MVTNSSSQIYYKPSITAELAEKMIQAAITKSLEIQQPRVIAILDESAHLIAFLRMDGQALISFELAQNKSYTAVAHHWGLSTNEIFKHAQVLDNN